MSEERSQSAVVLLSGGCASTTALRFAISAGLKCHALALYDIEDNLLSVVGASRVAAQYRVPIHTAVADRHSRDQTGLVRLGHAADLAVEVGASRILLGTSIKHPAAGPVQEAFQKTLQVSGPMEKMVVYSPVQGLDRASIIRWGATVLGVDYSRTDDCVASRDANARTARMHCGKCPGCQERLAAFALAGVDDPARYELSIVE